MLAKSSAGDKIPNLLTIMSMFEGDSSSMRSSEALLLEQLKNYNVSISKLANGNKHEEAEQLMLHEYQLSQHLLKEGAFDVR